MLIASAVSVTSFFIFLLFQVTGIYTGDSGDLVTAAATFGVPHPPGYALYTVLGALLNLIPISTPAWRVTLLSSIPHALVVGIVYLFVYRITKRIVSAIFASLLLISNYLFFLYAITPEVFALFDLFAIGLLYLLVVLHDSRNLRFIPIVAGIFGLSLTHHQVILFLIPPAALITFVQLKKLIERSIRSILIPSVGAFLFGLLPIFYFPIAARQNPVINWDRPIDISGIIQLLTRADYGSFVSGGAIGHTLYERWLSTRAYGQFIIFDWTIIGVGLIVFGFSALYTRKRHVFWMLATSALSVGPLFFFYASFPLVNHFLLGTYERFLLPSYVIFAVVTGFAVHELLTRLFVTRIGTIIQKHLVIRMLSLFVLLLYPLTMCAVSFIRFSGMRTDRTAENLGRDVLASAPPRSLILLSSDTILFTSQYVRYAVGLRSDVPLIHASRLVFPDYRITLKARFPDLEFPSGNENTYMKAFIRANEGRFIIMSNTTYGVGTDRFWVPHGLLYRLYSAQTAPSIRETFDMNRTLFQSFHDPRTGILSRYRHLMLGDVLDVYAYAHMNFANALLRGNLISEAHEEYTIAARYTGDTSTGTAWMKKGVTESVLGMCEEAMRSFTTAEQHAFEEQSNILMYRAITYRDCFHDATSAATLEKQYEQMKRSGEIPL